MSVKLDVGVGAHLYPVPAVMVSCGDVSGQRNIITIAWTGVLASDPPAVGVGVREMRHSYDMIRDTGEFVVNLPRVDQVEALDYCGVASGRDVDKFSECGLTPAKAEMLKYAPLIKECPVNLECRVVQRLELGSHDYFVGQVVRASVIDEWVDDRGKLAVPPGELITYARGTYHRVGDALGQHGFAGNR